MSFTVDGQSNKTNSLTKITKGIVKNMSAFIENGIRVVLDHEHSVLYARIPGVDVVGYRESPTDHEVILNLDALGNVAGVTVIGFQELNVTDWLNHPARTLVPENLRSVVDKYIGAEEKII